MKTINLKRLSVLVALTVFSLMPFQGQGQTGGGNADGDFTGETGVDVTSGAGSVGGNCGHGPNAHAGNANCGGGTTSIPLDGGISILLAAAAVFGIRKLRNK